MGYVFVMRFRTLIPKQDQLTIYAFLKTSKATTAVEEYSQYCNYAVSFGLTPKHIQTFKRYKRNYNRVLRSKRPKEI